MIGTNGSLFLLKTRLLTHPRTSFHQVVMFFFAWYASVWAVARPTAGFGVKCRCFRCNKLGHETHECWGQSTPMGITKPVVKTSAAVQRPEQFQSEQSSQEWGRETSAMCSIGADTSHEATSPELQHYLDDGWLELANGRCVPYVSSVHAQSLEMRTMRKMSVVRGLIGKAVGSVLCVTGCSGVVVKQQLVEPSQFLSKWGFMWMADNTVRRVRMATVALDTPIISVLWMPCVHRTQYMTQSLATSLERELQKIPTQGGLKPMLSPGHKPNRGM